MPIEQQEQPAGLAEYLAKIKRGEIEPGKIENNLVIKAQRKPKSLRLAINAMCFQCYGGNADEMPDPAWKKMIATCTAPSCALWPHRPYQNIEIE